MQTIQSNTSLTKTEKTTLAQILQEVTEADWRRYRELAVKFEDETLAELEYEDYLALMTKIEGIEVTRLENLAEMARKRNLPLVEFMRLCGLKSPSYV